MNPFHLFKQLSLLSKIIILVLGGFWTTLIVLGLFLYSKVEGDFVKQMQTQLDSDVTQFKAGIEQQSELAYHSAVLYANDARIIDTYTRALGGNGGDEESWSEAREAIKEIFKGSLAAFEKNDLGRLAYHFHQPNNRSLLRVWRSNQNESDDLSGFRSTVVQINQAPHRPILGIEIGRGGFAIRGIAPISGYDGKHLGSVEYLGNFNTIYASLSAGEGKEAGLYMDRAYLPIATSLQDLEKHPLIGDRLVLVTSTKDDLFVGGINPTEIDQVTEETIVSTPDYLIALAPIFDFSDQQIGVLAVAASKDKLAALQKGLLTQLLLAFLLSTLFIAFVIWRISKPLRVVAQFSDELAQGAREINNASVEVSNTSQLLAEGSSEQASSIEESSASLQEINVEMGEEVALAKRTQTSSTKAMESVSRGESAMAKLKSRVDLMEGSTGEMEQAMQAIIQSSNAISKIVRAIDDIAFQTNILALNAAVEAARAGEAGAGFAVVADEVRNLAQRAAEAAGETTTIIETAQKRSSDGLGANKDVASRIVEVLSCVQEVATELSDITEQVRAVGSEMSQLETSVTSQSQRITDISSSMSQISDVTQSSAASAEEAAASSEELNAQSQRLNEISGELAAIILGARQRTSETSNKTPESPVSSGGSKASGGLLRL